MPGPPTGHRSRPSANPSLWAPPLLSDGPRICRIVTSRRSARVMEMVALVNLWPRPRALVPWFEHMAAREPAPRHVGLSGPLAVH